jgi:hypothetical protein
MAMDQTPHGQSARDPAPTAVDGIPVADPELTVNLADAWMKAQRRVWTYSTGSQFLESLKADK